MERVGQGAATVPQKHVKNQPAAQLAGWDTSLASNLRIVPIKADAKWVVKLENSIHDYRQVGPRALV